VLEKTPKPPKTPNPPKPPKPQVSNNKDVALKEPGRHRVGGEQGLYLFVSPDEQVRRWIFRFTSPVTKRVTETGLGMASAVSLAQAKAKAGDLRKQIANDICPMHAKRAEQASRVTFREAADGWIATQQPAWKGGSNSSQKKNAVLLLYHHGAPLAGKRVGEISVDQIQETLKELWARTPNQARRTLSMFERVFDFAKARGWRQGDNPCAWKGNMEYRFPRQRATDRRHHPAMNYQALPGFVKELRKRQDTATWAVALEFLILTCARTKEVLRAQFSEIDWDNKVWVLPKDRTKQGREHTVPLSERAMALLTRQKEHSNGSEYIFTGRNQKPLDIKIMYEHLKGMGVKESVHGFRSSFRDYMGNETHFAREPVEECLAHAVGNSVERAYRRQDALNKRRVILDHWSEYCAGHGLAGSVEEAA
jgi:integrase